VPNASIQANGSPESARYGADPKITYFETVALADQVSEGERSLMAQAVVGARALPGFDPAGGIPTASGKSASSAFAPVHWADLEGQLRVQAV
jgi:hypothetical protein